VILENEGEIIGDQTITIEGFKIPSCPINDIELLEYVDKWSKLELSQNEAENDEIMMQIIEVWKTC